MSRLAASLRPLGLAPRRGDDSRLDPVLLSRLFWWSLAGVLGLALLEAARRLPLHPVIAVAALLALAGAALLVVHNPAWGCCALIVIVYANVSNVITKTWGFGWVLRLAMAGVIAAALLNAWTRSEHRRARWPVLAAALAYGVAQVAASFGAGNAAAARGTLFGYGKALVVFYLITNLLTTPRALRRAVNAVLFAAVAMSLPVIYQGVTGSHNTLGGFGAMLYEQIVPGRFGWRLGGAMGDPNFLAMMLVAALPLALLQALESRARRPRRAWALAAAGLTLWATLYTYSRASLIGIAVVVVVLVVKHRRRRWVWSGVVAALLISAAWMPQHLLGRLATLTEVSEIHKQELPDESFQIRRNAVYAGALMFWHHPLLGIGPGNFPDQYLKYSALVGLAVDPNYRDAHNTYIQIAAETGLVGLAAFVWLLVASFRLMERGRRRLRRLGAHSFADLVWALELALATYLTLSIFLHDAYFRNFLILLALGVLSGSLALHPDPPRRQPAGTAPLAAARLEGTEQG